MKPYSFHPEAITEADEAARFYEYSLGSARESRGWYYRGRYILGENVIHHHLQLLSEIIRLLLTIVPQQRGYVIRDETAPYLLE